MAPYLPSISSLFHGIQKEKMSVTLVGSENKALCEAIVPALYTWGQERKDLSHAPAPTEDTKGGCKIHIVLHPLSPASAGPSLLQSFRGKGSVNIAHCHNAL